MKIFVISITSNVMQFNGTARKICRPLVLLFYTYDNFATIFNSPVITMKEFILGD